MAATLRVVGDFIARKGSRLPSRVLGDWEIVYFPVPGATVYQVEGKTRMLSQPSIVLTRPGEEHAYDFDPHHGTRHLFIHFSWEPLFQQTPPGWWPSVVEAESFPLGGPMFQEVVALSHSRAPLWEERASSLVEALAYQVIGIADSVAHSSSRQHPPVAVTEALAYIEQHVDQPISVADVARAVSWSEPHLSRMFTLWLGDPPVRVLLKVRVAHACRLLQETTWTIREIAEAVGFRDENYFSRTFTHMKGITASEYRRKSRNDPGLSLVATTEEYLTSYPLNELFHCASLPSLNVDLSGIGPDPKTPLGVST